MDSYRTSHVGPGHGRRYDQSHAGKMDAVVWNRQVKPWLAGWFETCRRQGGRRYLDFASGTGRVLKFARRYFEDCTAIDISPDMLEVARERVPDARFHCVDVTAGASGIDDQFDCVTLFRFLLNAERELSAAALAWLSAHMPAGALLIGNNHMQSASFRGAMTILANRMQGSGHNHMSKRQVRELLETNGFRIRHWTGFRVLPTWKGKALLGSGLQGSLEDLLSRTPLQRVGSEQLFVAERV